jgi:hypothetical protein
MLSRISITLADSSVFGAFSIGLGARPFPFPRRDRGIEDAEAEPPDAGDAI